MSVAAAGIHDAYSVSGITVQADQNLTVTLSQPRKLETIGSVKSRAANALVKPGTTADVYSISATTQDKSSVLSGGGLQNSAWSAVSSVPGVFVAPGSSGYVGAGEGVSIRGGDYDQIGYELDGVPVNRSYDNYPSNQLSSLGQQELQVYTGASPANSEGQGISGYINQVIRTGTAPAYRSLTAAVGAPILYNKGAFETGGANPARTFNYYLGLGTYDQDTRYYDQFNGASLARTWGVPLSPCQNSAAAAAGAGYYTSPAIAPSCYSPTGADYTNQGTTPAYVLGSPAYMFQSRVRDHDTIFNVHFGLPQGTGGKDDVQVLFDNSHFDTANYSSTNDVGGRAYATAIGLGVPTYTDGLQFLGAPLGATIPVTYSGSGITPYLFPNSATGRPANDAIPNNQQDYSAINNMSVIKAQYQHNFGTNAFLRAYGYTYYSDWSQTGPQTNYSNYAGCCVGDYTVASHTRGASVQFSDQITSQHLITLQGNYTTSNVFRQNNTEYARAGQPFLFLVDPANLASGQCYSYDKNAGVATPTNCYNGTKYNLQSPKNNPTGVTYATLAGAAAGSLPTVPAGTMCGTSACQYLVMFNGRYANFNNATPHFLQLSATDNWHPTDKITVNAGLRLDQFQFVGGNTYNSPARQFLFAAYNSQAAAKKLPTLYNPNEGQTETFDVIQPRFGATFTVNPTTVLRASYGRYAQPPPAFSEQYNYLQPNAIPGLVKFAKAGLGNTFMHRIVPPVSNNYDFSVEKQLGRDLSLKFTPFLRQTQDQLEDFVLDQKTSFVSATNVGNQRSQGFELEVDKGDFARDGIAARLSLGYTDSYIRYNRFNGVSVVDAINGSISGYNAFTRGGGGSPCYTPAVYDAKGNQTGGGIGASCAPGLVANPYYNLPAQSLLDPNGHYAPFGLFPVGTPAGSGYTSYGAPYTATLLTQYKHGPLAVTPALQFVGGQRYGVPITTPGIDPSTCSGVLASSIGNDPRYPGGAPGGQPYDATTCPGSITIPNPTTGAFDRVGGFVQPSVLLLHLQTSYEVNKRLTLVANFANLYASCFGGSKVPFAVGGACSYGAPVYGTSIAPTGNQYNPGNAIQPIINTPYGPSFGASTPFNAYLEARLKL